MYLFVFADGSTRQVHDNLSVGDMLAIKEKTLRVYTVSQNKFMLVTIDETKIAFVPVPEGRVIQGEEARFHHP